MRKRMHHVNSEPPPKKLAPHPCPHRTLKIELAVLLQRPATYHDNLEDFRESKTRQIE